MHTTAAEAARLATAILRGAGDLEVVSVVLCPPFPYLALVGELLRRSHVALGAQNRAQATSGAKPAAKPEDKSNDKPDAKDDLKTLPMAEVEKKLDSSLDGLTQAEAQKRLTKYGPNEIEEKKTNPFLKFLSFFWGPIPWMIAYSTFAISPSPIIKHSQKYENKN